MTAMDAVIVAAIVAAFMIFGCVLAWVEHQTRDLPAVRSVGDRTEPADRPDKTAVRPDTDTAGTAIWQYLYIDAGARERAVRKDA